MAETIGKCVPIFSMTKDADVCDCVIGELFEFGILSAFMLSVQDLRTSAAEQVENLMLRVAGLPAGLFHAAQSAHPRAEGVQVG